MSSNDGRESTGRRGSSSGSSYCHRRGSQGDLFEASEKIVEEEEDEDYDDDAFEESFSKAFEPPGASRLKGSCLSRTSSESSIDSAAADTELLADLVDGAVAASAGDLPDHEVSGSVGPRDDREQNVKTDDVIVQLESPPRVPPVSAAAIAATPPRAPLASISGMSSTPHRFGHAKKLSVDLSALLQKSGDGNGNPIHLVQSPKIPSTVKVPPLGENRLPSAMRRPRGHYRSASQGAPFHHGVGQIPISPFVTQETGKAPGLSGEPTGTLTGIGSVNNTAEVIAAAGGGKLPGPSVLKKTSAFAQPPTHRRVFSHGQIKFNTDASSGPALPSSSAGAVQLQPSSQATTASSSSKDDVINNAMTSSVGVEPVAGVTKGHRRQGSKTEFILPPGHEERERKRTALHRSTSRGATVSSAAGAFRSGDAAKPPSSAAGAGGGGEGGETDVTEDEEYIRNRASMARGGHSRQGSAAGHRRLPSRSDSLGFSFRGGHSRQASRTDSIYTLRATVGPPGGGDGTYTSIIKEKLFFWNRCKQSSQNGGGGKESVAAAANGHTNGFIGAAAAALGDSATRGASGRTQRTVVPNHAIPEDAPAGSHPNSGYADNYVRTTKYTILTFLPKNLFEQFHRFANLYFLFIVLLNWVPAINAFGKEISMLPVVFVLGVTAIKDIFEDRRRYLSDKRVNNSYCRIFKRSMGRYAKCQWKDVKVGDFVHLSCNEMIPADILVLRSSDEHGLCYIDTQNLDGEANLKQREVPRGILDKQSSFDPQDFRGNLECDPPTTKIYRFHGSIVQPWGERVPVGKDNLLLRECVLKNTDFVEGLVVYAGHESKAMLNNGGPRYKRSKLERRMNSAVAWCVVFLVLMCFAGGLGSGLWLKSLDVHSTSPDSSSSSTPPIFLDNRTNYNSPGFEGFLTFWTFVIILQIIIPMSLYVTIECSKLIQIYLIHQDLRMWDDTCDKGVECRALNIPEELGQVQYIFCDKTGTLTENKMVFKRCTIGGIDYAHNSFEPSSSKVNSSSAPQYNKRSSSQASLSATPLGPAVAASTPSRASVPINPALAERLNANMDIQYLIEGTSLAKTKLHPQAQEVQDFFLLLAVCNTVIVAKHPHHDHMNASGVICASANGNATTSKTTPHNSGPHRNTQAAVALSSSYLTHGGASDSVIEEVEAVTSTTPPTSLLSTGTVTTSISTSSVVSSSMPTQPPQTSGQPPTAPLQPDPGLAAAAAANNQINHPSISIGQQHHTRQRPRMFDFLTGGGDRGGSTNIKPPLSPIASSPEEGGSTPTDSPGTNRPKHLQLPPLGLGLFSKLVSSSTSLHKHNSSTARASPTPTPYELRPIYEAESPDELALVDAAYAYNVKLLKRTPGTAVVSLPGEGLMEFQVLHVLPFDSVRKRMSIILRHPITKERILFCKGADSAMFPRLRRRRQQRPPAATSHHQDDPEAEAEEKTKAQLESYAKLGLRVLVMAKKVLDDDAEYEEWAAEHAVAENALHNRDRLLFESYNRMEWDLTLLGSTGIEDKLQEGVPDSIENLRRAGIVVWVLTGDKQETAVNIAYSCKLFSQNCQVIKVNARSRDAAEAAIRTHLESIEADETANNAGMRVETVATSTGVSSPMSALAERFKFSRNSTTSTVTSSSSSVDTEQFVGGEGHHGANAAMGVNKKQRALVIDGKTLVYILDRRANLQDMFLRLTSHCSSVLCCRATPLQKAYIVKIVKENLGMHTLAVGDGANDVSMIQTADVGVGISGQEGMQAVMASDFAVTRFKFLERLVLVHGHWNYDRLARMILYFFYKNAAFVFVCFWYELYCGFSGAVMIDQMYLMLYNLIFTSLPPMAVGVLDRDAPSDVLSSRPGLYVRGRAEQVYTKHSFWVNIADALYQSVIIYFLAVGTYAGSDVGIWHFGTVIVTQCLVVMSIHLAIETKSWTIVHVLSIVLSVAAFFVFALGYNAVCTDCVTYDPPFWVMQHAMGTPHFWLVTLLSAVAAILPRLIMRALEHTLCPDDVTRVMIGLKRGPHSSRENSSSTGNHRHHQEGPQGYRRGSRGSRGADLSQAGSSTVTWGSRGQSLSSVDAVRNHRGGAVETEMTAIMS